MYSRTQFIVAIAAIVCSLCVVMARPAAKEIKFVNRVSAKLDKRDGAFEISLGASSSVVPSIAPSATAAAVTPTTFVAPVPKTDASAVAASASSPTFVATAPLTTTHYTGTFVFTASFKDTDPFKDGAKVMKSQNKKGKKQSKKSLASAKSAAEAAKTATLTGTAAAAAAAETNA